ncbi:hypothetical protein [Thermoflexus hugenholtzii]
MKTLAILVFTLVLSQFYVNIGLAGHENVQYQSYYPHEIRFLQVDNLDVAVRLFKNTTTSGRVEGLHLYLGKIGKTEAKANYSIKYLNFITNIYLLRFSEFNRHLQNSKIRSVIAYGCINRNELAKEMLTSPLFIPLLPYHRETSYVKDIEERLKTIECTDIFQELKILKVGFTAGQEDLADKIVEQIKSNTGFKLNAEKVSNPNDWDILVTRIDMPSYVLSKLSYINGVYYGTDTFEGTTFIKDLFLNGKEKPEQRIISEEDLFLYTRSIVSEWYERGFTYPLMYDIEYYIYNDDYDEGLHNMAWSPLVGLTEPSAFFRTVKIKLFPWNGWLLVGSPTVDKCKFNPFPVPGDQTCYGLWSVLSDPAFVLNPYNLTFEPNRAVAHEVIEGDFSLPSESLYFDGKDVRVVGGEKIGANVKVLYRVLLGPYHHGVDMDVGDIVYALHFMKKWVERDAGLAKAAKDVLDTLRGVRVLNVTEVPFIIPNVLNSTKRYLWIEAYLKLEQVNSGRVVALTPPWSTLPWEILYLLDTVFEEGRLSIGDLDLVNRKTVDLLTEKLKEFRTINAVPVQLRGIVKDTEAKKRWDSLMSWFNNTGNLMVTNGPYKLAKKSESEIVLKAFRDPTYPLGIGSYDHLNAPRFARISKALLYNNTGVNGQTVRFEAHVEVEDILFHARSYSKEFKGSGSAKVFVYLVDEVGRLYYYSLKGKPNKEGVFSSALSSDLVRTLPPRKYYLFIVPIPSYQYYGLPATNNYMNTTYVKILLTIPGSKTEEHSMDAWLFLLFAPAFILAIFVFSRVHRRLGMSRARR